MRDESNTGGTRFGFVPLPSSIIPKLRRALRGEVTPREAVLEAARRTRAALAARGERAMLAKSARTPAPARLHAEFARLMPQQLLEHFRARRDPKFFAGFEEAAESLAAGAASSPDGGAGAAQYFASRPAETGRLIKAAREIAESRRWPLLGYGALEFGAEPDWLRDPVSGKSWPLDYHRDVRVVRGDGSDIRVLWELNRLAHLTTLARAHAATGDPSFAREFFRQLRHWRTHNPLGFGPNWACAMEVSLRAMNLLAAFALLGRSPETGASELALMLALLDEHGAHVRRNLEFSYLGTSNHYLSDVAGLLWLGLCLPELRGARGWREWALRELLREMDKQVLADGADAEASTGYHRFVTELFLHSFLLCRSNRVEIEDRHWRRLRAMLEYTRAYLRPDGLAPLVGDTDGGQVLPVVSRAADDHAYLVALGAAVFGESRFKIQTDAPEEVFWLTGVAGARAFESLARPAEGPRSQAFPHAGTYVMREGDLFLLFSACGAGVGGRGSHGHNDALSIEVSAFGASFLRDPGSFVYTSDFDARHAFRSTAYHSTVEVDGLEQNTTPRDSPFVIGDEARPGVPLWESGAGRDEVVGEHRGYLRLPLGAVTHRRRVVFDKRREFWLVEDSLAGRGRHTFRFLFQLAPGREARARPDAAAEVWDSITGARLLIAPLDDLGAPALEPRRSSSDYGAGEESQAACWTVEASAPFVARFALVPARAADAEQKFFELVASLKHEPPPGPGD